MRNLQHIGGLTGESLGMDKRLQERLTDEDGRSGWRGVTSGVPHDM